MLRPVDLLHLGQFGQPVERLARPFTLHGADRDVHPHERHGGDQEQQHEAAGPDAREVVQKAKGNG